MYIEERFPSFFFFFDLPWKRYSGIETGHVQFSNIFSHEKPRTFRLEKNNETKKKRKHWRRKKIMQQGFVQFLILSKIQRMEIQHQQHLLGKSNKLNNLGRKTFYGKLNVCFLPRPSFFFKIGGAPK